MGGLLDAVRQRLAESGADPTPARVAAALRAQGRLLGDTEVLGAAEELRCELVGTGPLEPLLADPTVTDVLVSAPDRVWVDRGGGLQLTAVSFADAASVRRLAQRLAATAGQPARRRKTLGGRPAARRDPDARGAAAGGRRLYMSVAAGGAAQGVLAGRADRSGDPAARRGAGAASADRGQAVLLDQWRHRHRQDHASLDAARPRRAG